METIEDLIDEYADEAARIYRERTAGDFTWTGLLGDFFRRVQEAGE